MWLMNVLLKGEQWTHASWRKASAQAGDRPANRDAI
jgi:hypothetical protein